jgi:heme/copper-type cytochrome/quinol oxidase subunit 2
MKTGARKELFLGLTVLGTVVGALGVLYAWQRFVVPTLSSAFLIDGSAADQVSNILMILGCIIVAVLLLLVWLIFLTWRLRGLIKEAEKESEVVIAIPVDE